MVNNSGFPALSQVESGKGVVEYFSWQSLSCESFGLGTLLSNSGAQQCWPRKSKLHLHQVLFSLCSVPGTNQALFAVIYILNLIISFKNTIHNQLLLLLSRLQKRETKHLDQEKITHRKGLNVKPLKMFYWSWLKWGFFS